MMNAQYTSRDAWEAFRDRHYELACHIWISLMTQALSLDSQRSYQLSYTHVLVAQQRYDEASAILKELFESDCKSIYLHQLAYVARESGDLALARDYLLQEKSLIPRQENLLLAANEFELSIICWLEGSLKSALTHARNSLSHAQAADDLTAEGCSHRRLADVLGAFGEFEEAIVNYRAAHQAFVLAGDSFAAKDIDRQLQTLQQI